MIITRLTPLIIILMTSFLANSQGNNFRIRTITAGVSLSNLFDTITINQAIAFLKKSKEEYTQKGYEVHSQARRHQSFHWRTIATQCI